MKHILSLLLTFSMLLSLTLLIGCNNGDADPSNQQSAAKPESEGLEFTLSDNGQYYIVTGIGSCRDTEIVIPHKHNGIPVRAIGDGAFRVSASTTLHSGERVKNRTMRKGYVAADTDAPEADITSVVVPTTVTEIGDEAFLGCENLENYETQDPTNPVATESVETMIALIGTDAFKDTAYYRNDKNWDNGILYVNEFLVNVRDDVSGTVTIREGTKIICKDAFKDLTAITNVSFPKTMKIIGERAFFGCTGITKIDLPYDSLYIETEAFRGCTALTEIVIGNDAAPIQQYKNVESMSEALQQDIREEFFETICSGTGGNLTYSEFTEKNYADEESEDSFITPGSSPSYSGSVNGGIIIDNEFQYGIVDTNAQYHQYQFKEMMADGQLMTYSGVLCDAVFADCTSLSKVKIGANVRYFGKDVFSGCTSLVEVDLSGLQATDVSGQPIIYHNGIYEVNTTLEGMFRGCTALQTVKLPKRIKFLTDTFEGCTSLASLSYYSTTQRWQKVQITPALDPSIVITCKDGVIGK